MRRKRQIGLMAIVLLIGFGVMFAFVGRFHDRLMDKATRVTSTTTWQPRSANPYGYLPHFWLSDHELLVFEGTEATYQGVRLDTKTGAKSPIPALSFSPQKPTDSALFQLSSDGKFLLWTDKRHRPRRPAATALDGSQEITWPRRYTNHDSVPDFL